MRKETVILEGKWKSFESGCHEKNIANVEEAWRLKL